MSWPSVLSLSISSSSISSSSSSSSTEGKRDVAYEIPAVRCKRARGLSCTRDRTASGVVPHFVRYSSLSSSKSTTCPKRFGSVISLPKSKSQERSSSRAFSTAARTISFICCRMVGVKEGKEDVPLTAFKTSSEYRRTATFALEVKTCSARRATISCADGARQPTERVMQSSEVDIPQCVTRGGRYKTSPSCSVIDT